MNLLTFLLRSLVFDLKDTIVVQHCSRSASETLTPEYTFLINGQDENPSIQHLEVINHANFKLDRNCHSLSDNKHRCEQMKQSKNFVIY